MMEKEDGKEISGRTKKGPKKKKNHPSEMFFCASMFPGTGLFLPHLFTIRLSFPLISAGWEVVNHSVSEWSFAFQPVPHLLSLPCSEFSPHSMSFHLVLVLLHCASSVLLSLKSLKPHLEVMIYNTPLSQV